MQEELMKQQPSTRASRRESIRDTEEFVIKTRLTTALKDIGTKPRIHELVLDVSKRMHRMSLLCNSRLRVLFEKGDKTCNHMFDQSYIRRMMLETDKEVDFKYMEEPRSKTFTLPPVGAPCYKSSNAYTQIAQTYLTNWKTYIETTMDASLGRYLRAVCVRDGKVPKSEVWIMKAMVLGWEHNREPTWANEPVVIQEIERLREILFYRGPSTTHSEGSFKFSPYRDTIDGKTVYDKIHSPHSNALRLIYLISENDVFEEANRKPLTLAPIHAIRRHYVLFDNTISEAWSACMWAPSKVSKKHVFTGTVSTDGISACMHFRRPSTEKSVVVCKKPKKVYNRSKNSKSITVPVSVDIETPHPNEIYNPEYRVIACDPGRVTLGTFIEHLGSHGDNKKSWHRTEFTRRQYYHEAGMNNARKQSEKWLSSPSMKNAIETMSETRSKAKSFVEFNKYIEAVAVKYDTLWNELSNRKWNNQRLVLHQGKQRCIDSFFNRVEKPIIPGDKRPLVIAYGDAGMCAGGRGERSVPVKWFKERMKTRFNVVDVDEFRTSKIVYQTQELLGKVCRMVGEDVREVRGLHWYKTRDLECKFVHRDANAAKNIHLLFHYKINGLERPEVFKRVEGTALPRQPVKILLPNETGQNTLV